MVDVTTEIEIARPRPLEPAGFKRVNRADGPTVG
jgi:hypothetical protein